MVVKLLGFFWLFTWFFDRIGEIYSVMLGRNDEKWPSKIHEEFTQKISSFMDGMSPTRGPSVFEKNDLCPQEDLFVLNSWNTYTKQNRVWNDPQ